MSRGFVLVKGCAGLGNRLITATAAIEYAIRNERQIHIDWTDGQFAEKGVNAFEKYFCLRESKLWASRKEVFDSNLTCYPSKSWQTEASINDIASRVGLIQNSWFINNAMGWGAARLAMSWKLKTKLGPIIFAPFSNSYLEFGEHLRNDLEEDLVVFASFRPQIDLKQVVTHISLNKETAEKLDSFVLNNELETRAIGIHVRHTDKEPIRNFKLVKNHIDRLRHDLDIVFICTDNQDVEKTMKNWFPKTISQDKFYPNDYTGGLHQYSVQTGDYRHLDQSTLESIIDLWSLSRCKFLFYQGNSSFSLISNAMRSKDSESSNWLDL